MILKYIDPALKAGAEAVTPLDKQLTTWGKQKRDIFLQRAK